MSGESVSTRDYCDLILKTRGENGLNQIEIVPQRKNSAAVGTATFLFVITFFTPFATPSTFQSPHSDSKPESLVQREPWSCLMSNQVSEFYFQDRSGNASVPVRWEIRKLDRVIAKGRADRVNRNNQNEVRVRVSTEEIQVDAVIRLDLEVDFGNEVASQRLYLFPDDPFLDQQNFLKAAEISLFDPQGDTTSFLKELHVPFKRLDELAELETVDNGLVIVGEGFRTRKPELIALTLSKLASRGVNVLWLAPSINKLGLEMNERSNVGVFNNSIVRKFDARFDIEFWWGSSPLLQRWTINQAAGRLLLTQTDDPTGWPWVELNFDAEPIAGKRSGTLVICGFGIIQHRNRGPVARHLLWRMIEKFSMPDDERETLERQHDKTR